MILDSDPADRSAFDRRLRADVRLLASIRAEMSAWLDDRQVRLEDRDAIVLAASEALANAIEHGYRDQTDGVVAVQARLSEGRIEVTVRDTGSWIPMRRHPDRGRGLAIIEKLMDWSEITTGRGTTVSMQRRVVIETE